jgi:hypothetical protein
MRRLSFLIPVAALLSTFPFVAAHPSQVDPQIRSISFDAITDEGDVIDRAWNVNGFLIKPDGTPVRVDLNFPQYTAEDAIAAMLSHACNVYGEDDSLTSVTEREAEPDLIQLNGCSVALTANPVDDFKSDGALVIGYHGDFGSQRISYGPKLGTEFSFSVFGEHQMLEQSWELKVVLTSINGGVYKNTIGLPEGTTMDAIAAVVALVLYHQDDQQYATITKYEKHPDRLVLKNCVATFEVGPEDRNRQGPELMMAKRLHKPKS